MARRGRRFGVSQLLEGGNTVVVLHDLRDLRLLVAQPML
ncbi:hypothetical protein PC129_g18844 [Phytophthora cactorum]|uniref:Uncharacterized protein n=1 Tax=Phytophthora cactorum TaxID=29920 RepID=A0A8T1D8M2_9STRA|nr:hypothetical protein Pcac1_g10108 [Phytophthora cactorum]KAG2889579.1 hypothetical protein PC114_g17913 [Phytophthora cactorum]KAG2935969.1 hypothetical protein PC117_g12272 [Phytophthora cactorum]KAG3013964.1 hypothetical protein PC119_g12303 [Phytophthora cactorum]KAG3176400.1 hypothetical protein C6341_g8986 [Phytophthora cactorum]